MREIIAITSSGTDRAGNSVNPVGAATLETTEHGGTFNLTSGGYINMGKINNPPLTEFTISSWVRIDVGTGQNAMWICPQGNAGGRNFIIIGSYYYYAVFQNGEYGSYNPDSTSKYYNDGKFHHYAITRDSGGTVRQFIDGNIIFKYTPSPAAILNMFDGTKDVYIGADTTAYPIIGKIADFIMVDKCMWNNNFIPPKKSIVDYGWNNTSILILHGNEVWRWE